MTKTDVDLGGLGVLVTRPAHQSVGLCRLIERHGGRPIAFPAMVILLPADPASAARLLAESWDLVIYVSPNAVNFAAVLGTGLPSAGLSAAVGKGTAKALAAAGVAVDRVPDRFDSEGLLALSDLADMGGKRVLIVRGQGGRALLGDTLARRGAEVHYAEVYRRGVPEGDPAPLLARWREDVQIVAVTSTELLQNLIRMLGVKGAALLRETPLLVISERMLEPAHQMGMRCVHLAAGADDDSIFEALRTFATAEKKETPARN